ncbi:hypothetical protein OROMI_021005 [Orobanche minor]
MATILSFLSPNLTRNNSTSPLSFYKRKFLCFLHQKRKRKFLCFRNQFYPPSFPLASNSSPNKHNSTLLCNCSTIPFVSTNATHYEQFNDDSSEVELRMELGDENISPADIFVDANGNSLLIRVQKSKHQKTLLDTNSLYGMIKPSETIWYIDDDAQLVVNLKKQDPELKWPDLMESWKSLTSGLLQLLKGTSVFLVGESSEINLMIARELAVGLGYTPLCTKELLEVYTTQTIDSCE